MNCLSCKERKITCHQNPGPGYYIHFTLQNVHLLEFSAEAFWYHVHHFQCLVVPVRLAAMKLVFWFSGSQNFGSAKFECFYMFSILCFERSTYIQHSSYLYQHWNKPRNFTYTTQKDQTKHHQTIWDIQTLQTIPN